MEILIKNLNKLLADLNVFYRKLQNYHWNVKGNDFFVIHPKLEEYYNEINEEIDEIAEHILVLKGEPLGTLKDYINTTSIEEAENKKIESIEILKQLEKDFNLLLKDVKQIKEKSEEINEHRTSTMMDELIDSYSEKIWMISQTIL